MYNYLHKDNVGRVDIGVCHNCILGHIARKATESVHAAAGEEAGVVGVSLVALYAIVQCWEDAYSC